MRLGRCLAVCVAVLWQSRASAADLSPAQWPATVRTNLEQRDFFTTPPYSGTVHGKMLVTGTLSRVATHAGIEALRRGGTAADAAATVALTQVTLEAGSVTSFAGVGQLVYFDAKSRKVYALDAGWNSYLAETSPASIPDTDADPMFSVPTAKPASISDYGRQTLVPGFMAGIDAMHARFGRLAFAELFQPAIWYAEKGVIVTPRLAGYFKTRQPALWRKPEGRRFASMPDGSLPKSGDLFRQPDLARTLRAVAAHGASYMYTGDWARAFVAAVQENLGNATLEDQARNRAQFREPLSVSFEGSTAFAPGEDSRGSCPTLEALNLLSGMHVETLGAYWRDAAAFRAHMRALWFAEYASGSPDVVAAERQAGFSRGCVDRLTPRYAGIFGPNIEVAGTTAQATAPAGADTGGHTEAVIVVDRWGHVAAFVHTINTVDWGDTGIVVGGIPISDAAAYYKQALVGLRPGDRLPSGLTPVIALKDGKPVLAVASVGLSIIPETVRLVTGVLAGHDDPATLMAAPPLLNIAGPPPHVSLWQWPEPVRLGAYDAATLKAFVNEGVPVEEISAQRAGNLKGTAVMAIMDPKSGEASAVEAPNVFDVAESDEGAGPPPPKEVAVPADVLDRYVGDYKVTLTAVTHVRREGDHLYVETDGRPRVELYARSPTDFFEKVGDAEMIFKPDAEGNPTMIVHKGGFETAVPRRSTGQGAPVR